MQQIRTAKSNRPPVWTRSRLGTRHEFENRILTPTESIPPQDSERVNLSFSRIVFFNLQKGETIKLPTKSGKQKLGHRRVNTATGEVTYKKTSSSSISGAIQLGIAHSVGSLSKVSLTTGQLSFFIHF